MKHKYSIGSLGILLFSLFSCEEMIRPEDESLLTINLEQITLPTPMMGTNLSSASVLVTNSGSQDLLINSIQLQEADAISELSFVLNETWSASNYYILQAQEQREILITWQAKDTQIDRGTLTLTTDTQELVVQIETAAIQREMVVTSMPSGMLDDQGQSITLTTPPNTSSHTDIKLTTTAIPIELYTLCWSDAEGNCIAQAPPSLQLCSQASNPSNTCTEPAIPDRITTDSPKSFSIWFTPTQQGQIQTYLSLQSDASNHPSYLITVTAQACIMVQGQSMCSFCGDGTVDTELGELCDDGNTLDGDTCSSTCQPSIDQDDQDGDMVMDQVDNCHQIANPDQADIDQDGLGDVCDDNPNTPDLVLITGSVVTSATQHVNANFQLSGTIVTGTHRSTTPEFQLSGSLTP